MRLIALLVGVASMAWAQDALSCSCMNLTIEEKIDRTPFVFRARVTNAEWTETGPEGTGRIQAKFTTLAVLKGDPSTLDALRTTTGLGSCGVPIVVGLEYVFFLTAQGEATLCGGTMQRHGVDFGEPGGWFAFVTRYGLGTE